MKHNKELNITLSLLLILFIGLKLGGIINWSWWWVLSPIWIPLSILVIFIFVIFVIYKSKK